MGTYTHTHIHRHTMMGISHSCSSFFFFSFSLLLRPYKVAFAQSRSLSSTIPLWKEWNARWDMCECCFAELLFDYTHSLWEFFLYIIWISVNTYQTHAQSIISFPFLTRSIKIFVSEVETRSVFVCNNWKLLVVELAIIRIYFHLDKSKRGSMWKKASTRLLSNFFEKLSKSSIGTIETHWILLDFYGKYDVHEKLFRKSSDCFICPFEFLSSWRFRLWKVLKIPVTHFNYEKREETHNNYKLTFTNDTYIKAKNLKKHLCIQLGLIRFIENINNGFVSHSHQIDFISYKL